MSMGSKRHRLQGAIWFGILLAGMILLAVPEPGYPATDQELIWAPNITGLTKGNLTLYLDRETPTTADDFASQSTTSITVAEVGSTGRYIISGLPGWDPGDDYNFVLTICYGGTCWQASYPPRTLSASNIVWGNLVTLNRNTNRYAVGATTPDTQLEVKGLGQNPTGSTVTFTAKNQAGTTVINDAAGSISGISETVDEDTGISTWSATLTWDTSSTLTATAGNYKGRFKVVFGDGEIIYLPIEGSMTLEVYPW